MFAGSEAAEQPNAASVVNDVSGQKRGKLEGSTESPAKLLKERDVAMATAVALSTSPSSDSLSSSASSSSTSQGAPS